MVKAGDIYAMYIISRTSKGSQNAFNFELIAKLAVPK